MVTTTTNLNTAIVIFAYNRPLVLEKTLYALKENIGIKNHTIIFFCDGPKVNANSDELNKIKQVRTIVKSINWCKKLIVNESETNKGLANSLVEGITKTLQEYDAIIVIEDDIKTSPYFLQYMTDALAYYKNKEEVISISGFNYPVKLNGYDEETFFIRGADCWGWATWKRGWELYEHDGQKLLDRLLQTKDVKNYNFDGGYNYLKMLKHSIKTNHSWAIKWYTSAYLKNKITLYPTISYVENIGVGIDGTNTKTNTPWIHPKHLNNSTIKEFNNNLRETQLMRQNFAKHFKKHNKFSSRLFNYVLQRLKLSK
jgi:hypothetical protein